MILRILKPATMEGTGTFPPGTVVNVPRAVGEDWISAGVARIHDGSPFVAPVDPSAIPEGMFWCEKHNRLHKVDSKPGKVCLKRLKEETTKEEEEDEN